VDVHASHVIMPTKCCQGLDACRTAPPLSNTCTPLLSPSPIDLGRLSRPVSPWSPTRGQTIPPFPLLQAHPTQHVIVATCTSLLLLDNSPAPFSHSISLPVRGHPQCATCTPARGTSTSSTSPHLHGALSLFASDKRSMPAPPERART
jgi:hypothetical protein